MHKSRKPSSSLNRLVFMYLLAISFTAIGSIGAFWLYSEFDNFRQTSARYEERFIQEKRQTLVKEVERALGYIEFMKARTEKRLMDSIRSRTYEAYDIAAHIYETNKDDMAPERIERLVKEALRPIRFSNGRGYYFATRLDGVEELFADRPELEGLNLLSMQDTEGRYVIRDMIELVRKEGEGFYRYAWTKPQQEGKGFPKIAFIKYFEPFDWFIGTGEYLDDVARDVQQEVIERIEQIRFGTDGYIFAGTLDGVSLAGPAKGKNMIEVTDPNGVRIVQELIKAARAGGGFVRYTMPQFEGVKNAPKLSYATSIDEWNWYLGAGVYVGEIEAIIAEERKQLQDRVRNYLITIVITLVLLSVGVVLLAHFVSGRLKKNFDQFARFFTGAATQHIKIDSERLDIQEFADLATAANRMIDSRNRTEHALQENKKWVDTIFNSIQSGIMVIDPETHAILDVNPEAERILGDVKSNIVGKACHDYVCQHERGQCPILDLGRQVVKEEREVVTSGGRRIPVIKSASLVTILDRPVLVESFIDMTEKKALEEQLRQSEKMQALGTLAGGIAHDFNNLMMGIQGRTSIMLHETPPADPHHEHLQSITEYIKNASNLTRQLLGLARGGKYDVKPTDINRILHQQVTLFGRTRKEITISEHYAADIGTVEVDRNQMIQVFWNLFINAGQAMPKGGTLYVQTENAAVDEGHPSERQIAAGTYVRLTMRDTGVGMDAWTLQRAFDPFFTTREKERGTGLGLASVYGIIKNHNGFIDIDSEPGSGTTVTIHLPVSGQAAVHVDDEQQQIVHGAGTILLIDDEAMILEVGSKMLEWLGYEVMTAASGEQALELFRSHRRHIKAVILDMIMPGMGGAETYEALAAIDQDVIVILSSGYSLGNEAEALLAKGARAFIQKPFNLEALSNELSKVVD